MPGIRRSVVLGVILAIISGAGIVYAFVSRLPLQGVAQTQTASAYQIEITPLNHSLTANAGSVVTLLFNITSPKTGALYFYASSIPQPGAPWMMSLQNITTGHIKLPRGVNVSYPTGQATFGTTHAILTLRVTLSSIINGTVGLVVGVFQQASPGQVVGTGNGVYITVKPPA